MPIAHVNESGIYYETHGNGVPIVFVHGLGATHSMFRPQIEFFKQTYQVIVVDLRGNGRSGKIDIPVNEILSVQCADIAQLLDYLHTESAVFVGVSYGGVFVQKFTHLYPDKVRGLIIADSFCDIEPKSIWGHLGYILAYPLWYTYYIPGSWFTPLLRLQYRKWDLAYEEMKESIRQKRSKELLLQRLAINKINFSSFLPEIQVPVLGIVGNYTKIGVKIMKHLVELIPTARLEIFDNSFDPSNLCQPALFNQTVAKFLADNQLV